MTITLQRRCQPGINCLRSRLCGIRMKTTCCSASLVTEEAIPVEKRLAAFPAAQRRQAPVSTAKKLGCRVLM